MSSPVIQELMSQALGHLQANRFAEAAKVYNTIIQLAPEFLRARACLGGVALSLGWLPAAEKCLSEVVNKDPQNAIAANNLALLYARTDRIPQACNLFRNIIQVAPQFAEARANLGNILLAIQDHDGAVEAYESAVALRPNDAASLTYLATSHVQCLQLDRGLDCLRRAMALGTSPLAHSSFLFLGMFAPEVTGEELAAAAVDWQARYADKETRRQGDRENADDSLPVSLSPCLPVSYDRPLRIAYLSPHFCNHSISWMAMPLLTGHDREHFVVHCYSDVNQPDAVTERIRGSVSAFYETKHLSDEQLAEVIRQDKIDVLIDMNLHMAPCRMGTLARKPAPVQVNYLAYPFTSGLRAMDYRVTDAILEPPGEISLGPEALIRLQKSYWLYRPDFAAPRPVEQLPTRAAGRFTFGCFNSMQKYNSAVAATWARIVNRVPGSRLLLFAERPEQQHKHFVRLFSEAGLDPSRFDLVGLADHDQYLAYFKEADLCLDPFPYGGNTTTLNSLWMGVPVLTRTGSVSYMRGAASILHRVGLDELVALSAEEYEELAVALSSDLERLEALRHNLRERMRASVLCDEASWIADFERGLRLAWRRYCEGSPPAEIELSHEWPEADRRAVPRERPG